MENDDKLSQFEAVTGVNTERARFYLESAAWQLEVALANFYENDGEENVPMEDLSDRPVNTVPVTASPVVVAPSKPKPRTNSRFATVQSMNEAQQAEQDNSSDEEEGQAFYAGGSRSSGQQILGPPKKRDIVSEMFKSVQEHGAEVVDPHHHHPGGQSSSFTGTGYRLGQTTSDTTLISPPAQPQQTRIVVLKLWREGFTLGNGPMRLYSDPTNREFLDYVKRGEIPTELTREAHGQEVHLDLEDHRHEEFKLPKTASQAFTGRGHTLGSPAPNVVSSVEPPKPDVVKPQLDKGNEEKAITALEVDDKAPCTNVQVRLSDGSRLSGRFNHSHTVGDLRRYITLARPQYEATSFVLMTSYPSRELVNLDETLAQAGLLNAAVMQRMK